MRWGMVPLVAAGLLLAGCVPREQYQQTAADLEAARKITAEAVATLEAAQKVARAQIEALEQEKARIGNELLAVQGQHTKLAKEVDSLTASLETERQGRQDLQGKLDRLRGDADEGQRVGTELRRERDLFKNKAEDLQRRLDTAQQELAGSTKAQADARTRITALEKEKEQAVAALTQAKNQARDLETKLAAEQVKLATLREEKQKLMSGTTTAQEEVAKLQKRAGELETEAARVADLQKRLEERDQEIAKLRQGLADRQTLQSRVTALTEDLEKAKERITALTTELKGLGEEVARVKRERDELLAGAETLRTSIQQRDELLKAREEEQARLDRERTARDEEARRRDATSSALAKALAAEIAKGQARVRQERHLLTITLADGLLFESGQVEITPAGTKVLQRIGEILKGAGGGRVLVEGHTDNVPIGNRLRRRYPTNWELSMARATSVLRRLAEHSGLDHARLGAAGYADTRPIASNDTEEGRTANRRITIILYPNGAAEPAAEAKP